MSDLFSKISEILSDPEASRKIRQIADSISSNSSVPSEEESQPDFSPAEDASAETLLPALTESLGSLGTVSSGPHSRDLQLLADAARVLSCAGWLTLLLFRHMPYIDQLFYVFPAIYTFTLSSERKTSIVYWLIVMALIFNMISVVTYPVFELLPQITHVPFPSVHAERFVCIIVTNIALFAALKLLIQIKRGCSVPGTSSYAAFMITLSAAFLVEESLYSLFLNVSDETIVPFFWAYIGLIVFTMMTVLLFRMVSMDADRKNRYQTEIAMLSLTRQHQQELSQMYEDLTQRQHDYRHHLQTLQELVTGSGESTAKAYLETVLKDTDAEEMIVTGNPGVDALLAAKRRLMREKGIAFQYSPYPLAELPLPTADFCSIVGNLLDNAIEGVQRIPDRPRNPTIHLTFSRSWNMFYIYCENPCDPSSITASKGRFVSSKKKDEPGLHGIGLHSIEAIAQRAEGRAEFGVEGDVFHAKVVVPYLDGAKKQP